MGITFGIDAERGVMEERWTGAVHLACILDLIEEKFGREDFGPGLRKLLDLGDATLELSYADMQQIVERLRSGETRLAGQRWAVIASGAVQFGLARMFEALADELPMETQVFREEGAARAWLGL